ncbi:MAG TPA: succinyldiaminopimelate transaminase, partial [Deltaproteobacteria bacterium]|nr:succinyldiaminopimelate transaminase [Deltaproteobacteria bacterium]
MPRYNPLLDETPEYPFEVLDRIKARLRSEGRPVYDFTRGDPVEPSPDFARQALFDAIPEHCPYPTVRGPRRVREAIAGYLKRRYDLTVDPDTQVIPTAGAKEAVFHLPLLVIDPNARDRAVLFPDPGYPACGRGAAFAGGESIPITISGDYIFRPWELDPALLERTRMMWINTPHNPSGSVTSLADLERTVELCRRYDILLASDETYADIYTDTPPPSVLEVTTKGVLALHSLSKRSGMTGYRSGFLTGDPTILKRVAKLRTNPGLVPQDFVNAAAAAAWDDDAHVDARRALFARKKAAFLPVFEALGLRVLGADATIYLWVQVPEGHTDHSFAEQLVH